MSLDIYLRRDIANVLRGVSFAGEGAAGLALGVLNQAGLDVAQANSGLNDAELNAALDAAGVSREKLVDVYRQGFRTALIAVGLAFGLAPEGSPAGGLDEWQVVRLGD